MVKNNPEILDGGKRFSYKGSNLEKKRDAVSKSHSYSTEHILRQKCDSEIKANPGMRSAILGKYRKY